MAPDVQMIGRPIITIAKRSRFELARGVSIRSARWSNPLGNPQPCVLRTIVPGARLVIGPQCAASGTTIVAARSIHIGEQTIIGAGAMIIDTDFHRLNDNGTWGNDFEGTARPVTIGESVFIGARAIILKGVSVGDRAIVGAGAVVAKDVPADSVVGGNPAGILRQAGGAPK